MSDCTNTYCVDGWVHHGDGVSFGSWPCMVCERRIVREPTRSGPHIHMLVMPTKAMFGESWNRYARQLAVLQALAS